MGKLVIAQTFDVLLVFNYAIGNMILLSQVMMTGQEGLNPTLKPPKTKTTRLVVI